MATKEEERKKREAGGFWSKYKGKDNPLSRMRGGRAGVHAFANPKERRLAALQMYYDRMHGATMKDLIAGYKLSYPIINRMLKEVMDDDLVKNLEQQILKDVVPMAIGVYKKKLEEGSEFVAKDVLQNFAKIADRGIKREELKRKDDEDEDSLEFLMRIKGKRRPQLTEEVIDGTVNSSGNLLPAAVEEQVAEIVRGDLQTDGSDTTPPAPILSKTSGKGGFPARVRQVNGGEFTSVRDLLKEKMTERIGEVFDGE